MTSWSWKSAVIRRIYPSYQGPSQLSIEYRRVNGFAPDLQRPRLLSERILHRILFDRDPLLHTFCDKVAAKQWISERIGPGHTPRTLALASSVAELQATPLPERWMLKASHGSGWYQRVEPPTHPLDGIVLDHAQRWLDADYSCKLQEWGYKGVPRVLLAEELLSLDGGLCTEVSAFCFRGRVRGLRIYRSYGSRAVHRSNQARVPRTKEYFLDENFNPLPLVRPQHDHLPSLVPSDRHQLEAIKELSQAISAGTSFLRVDSYLSDVGIMLGELTPYPGAGIWLRMPRQWDAWFGAFWD